MIDKYFNKSVLCSLIPIFNSMSPSNITLIINELTRVLFGLSLPILVVILTNYIFIAPFHISNWLFQFVLVIIAYFSLGYDLTRISPRLLHHIRKDTIGLDQLIRRT